MSTQVRENVSRAGIKPARARRLPLGLKPFEIIAAAVTLIFFLLVVVYYMTNVQPEQQKLERLKVQDRKQQIEIADYMANQGTQPAPQFDQGREALTSLETFKSGHLLPRLTTESKLRDTINTLAAKHGLQIVGGIPMNERRASHSEESGDNKRKQEQESLDVFPRLEADFGVAGDYSKLRAFLKDLESTRMFILTNAVTLSTQEQNGEGLKSRAINGIQLSIKVSIPFREE